MNDATMKTHIRWFSATGNSLATASSLAEALGAASCEPLLSTSGGRAEDGPGRYVLVFPLFYLGIPKAVDDALRAFSFRADDDIAAVITRGVPGMGAALGILSRLLRKRGFRLRYGAYLNMPNNDLVLFSEKSEEKNRARLDAAPERIRRIAGDIAEGKARRDIEPVFFMGGIRQKHYREHILGSHARFYADSSCTGCGVCARVCPLGRIELSGGRPAWKEGCQECEACINLCPAAAIQYKGSETEAKARYRHPAIAWQDIAAQRPGT
jgi:ferredoxin